MKLAIKRLRVSFDRKPFKASQHGDLCEQLQATSLNNDSLLSVSIMICVCLPVKVRPVYSARMTALVNGDFNRASSLKPKVIYF